MGHKAVVSYVIRILKDHRDRLVSIIRRWCRDPEDFEDILQNILFKVHTTRARFEGHSHISTWLYRVAVNESINFYRKNRHHTEGRVDVGRLFLPDPFSNPERDAERIEEEQKLDELASKLGEAYQTAFTLYFINEMTIKEMSRALNISSNAVRCKVFQARQRLLKEADRLELR